jgi:hypothetical protein
MPIYSNAPSQFPLSFLLPCLLLWFPFVLQVGALLGLEDQYDDGRGSSLIFFFLFFWLFGIHEGFYRWLKSLE